MVDLINEGEMMKKKTEYRLNQKEALAISKLMGNLSESDKIDEHKLSLEESDICSEFYAMVTTQEDTLEDT